jgi:small-conductance mechanosensitive channel
MFFAAVPADTESLDGLGYLLGLGQHAMVTVGDTDISVARVAGLFFILAFSWWFSTLLESALRHVALHGRHHAVSSTVYAFTRLVRYVVWIVGALVGLNHLGFSLASLAFLGGAIGVGIGFGLQNIFQNFISGIIILVEKTLKIGDFVDLQSGVRGTVTEIGMRYTRITTNGRSKTSSRNAASTSRIRSETCTYAPERSP